MNCHCDQFFARAGRTRNQYGQVAGGDLPGQLDDTPHGRSASDDPLVAILIVELFTQFRDLRSGGNGLDGLFAEGSKNLKVERLLDEIEGPALHRLYAGRNVSMGSYDDGFGVGLRLPRCFQNVELMTLKMDLRVDYDHQQLNIIEL